MNEQELPSTNILACGVGRHNDTKPVRDMIHRTGLHMPQAKSKNILIDTIKSECLRLSYYDCEF